MEKKWTCFLSVFLVLFILMTAAIGSCASNDEAEITIGSINVDFVTQKVTVAGHTNINDSIITAEIILPGIEIPDTPPFGADNIQSIYEQIDQANVNEDGSFL
jgi:hypothetical protein